MYGQMTYYSIHGVNLGAKLGSTSSSSSSSSSSAIKIGQGMETGLTIDNNSTEKEECPHPKVKKTRAFWFSFATINFMVSIVSFDAPYISPSLSPFQNQSNKPQKITNELHGTTLEAYWTSLSFLLVVAVCQPNYTSLSEVFGRMARSTVPSSGS
jgi:hypothetical protein